jgi:hypothetical protein
MKITESELMNQLTEYRKAIRAMMHFYDASWSLRSFFFNEMKRIFKYVDAHDLLEEIDETFDKPPGISQEAYRSVTAGVNNWWICCSTNEKLKPYKNEIFFEIDLYLDYWPTKIDPRESISAIGVYGYHITEAPKRIKDTWDDLYDEKFYFRIKSAEHSINKKGYLKNAGKIEIIPGEWSFNDGKYKASYAAGLYDISQLLDENSVRKIIVSDINKIKNEWNQ